MHPVITGSKLPANLLPTSEVVCTICPLATWFSTPTEMRVYCGQMFREIWSSIKKETITVCSAQQDARLEQMLTAPPAADPVPPTQVAITTASQTSDGFGLIAKATDAGTIKVPPGGGFFSMLDEEGTVLANPPSESTFL